MTSNHSNPAGVASLLLFGNVNLAGLDGVGDGLWTPAVNLAAGRERSAENLLDGTLEFLGHGLVLHLAGDLDDLVQGDGLGVLDVLLLLAVTRGLLESLDDERRGGWNNGDGGLTVLDGKADGHTKTFLWHMSALKFA